MAGRAAFYLKLAIFFGLLMIVVPMLVGGWLMWKRPLTVDAWFSRFGLSSAGLSDSQVATPDGSMTIWEGGSGTPMVLLHGAGDQAGAWARVVQPLVKKHRVLIPDLPGHWKSDPTDGPIGVDQVLAGIEALMDARCSDEAAILVGNSLGAWVACLYARQHPDRLARVVLVNAGPITEKDPKVNLFPTNRDEARETMRGLMGPDTPMPPDFVLDDIARHSQVGPAARFAQTAAEMGPYLLDGRLDEVTVPVEMVWGDADQLMTVEYAQPLLDGLPAARLTLVENCGHVPQRECPDRFLTALNEVLALPPPVVQEEVVDPEDEE